MLEHRLFDRLVREVARRVLGEPPPVPSRVHQALSAAVALVGGGLFVYWMPHHFSQPPRQPWSVLVSILAGCGVASLTLAVAGKYRVGVLRAAAALGVIGFTVAALFVVIATIGLGIAYVLGWMK